MKEKVSIDQAIEYLNELLELDRPAIAALLANRVPCNHGLATHPTVQVDFQHGGFHVGMLGILNGLFGVDRDGWGPITFIFDNGNLTKFVRTDSLHKLEQLPKDVRSNSANGTWEEDNQ